MKANKLLENVFFRIKNEKYVIDYPFGYAELFKIFLTKFVSLLRGMIFIKPFLKTSGGFVFAEPGVRISFGKKIRCGRGLYLKRGASIDALSYGGISIGNNFSLGRYARIECTGVYRDVGNSLKIGHNVGVNDYCYISVRGDIEIGNHVIIGPGAKIFSEKHNFDDREIPIRLQGETKEKTIIKDDVWIGANACIAPGVTVGKGSVIGMGSVVTKDVDDYSIMGGVPAELIGKRGK